MMWLMAFIVIAFGYKLEKQSRKIDEMHNDVIQVMKHLGMIEPYDPDL